MRKAIIIFSIIVAVGAIAYLGYGAYRDRQAAAAPTPTPEADAAAGVVWASGKLVPARWAGLSPAAGGTIATVAVAEGDAVEAGQLLIGLDDTVLLAQAAAAEAAVAEAEAAKARLLAGSSAHEIIAAEADVAAAQAAVAQAQAALKQARDGVAAVEAQAAVVRAQYDELLSRPTAAEKAAARELVDQARLALEQAQRSYDRVAGDPQIGARPEALALQQATVAWEAAKAGYDLALQGATGRQRAVAKTQVDAARAQVGVAQGQIAPAEAGVQQAEAGLARARAALDRLRAGPTAEDVAQAIARVRTAEAALATTRAALGQARVVAPFAGKAGAVYARPGEQAQPGQPLVILGDTASMRIETTDLRETDVARLREGMAVEVTFDALPGRTFAGTVARIAPMSSTEKGSTNYTLIVEAPELDPALRWGMTAFVNIQGE